MVDLVQCCSYSNYIHSQIEKLITKTGIIKTFSWAHFWLNFPRSNLYSGGSVCSIFNCCTNLRKAVRFIEPVDFWNISPSIFEGTLATSTTRGVESASTLLFTCFSVGWIDPFSWFTSLDNTRLSCFFQLTNSCESWSIFHIVVTWHHVYNLYKVLYLIKYTNYLETNHQNDDHSKD